MADYKPSELLSRQLSSLPDSPGCYIFKDDLGEILYIGKALSLKSRVRSYFVETSWRERPKLFVMMPKVASLETILVNSEKEALLLEANLIREKKPRYNVALKDDRRYPWLAITYGVDFPRLVMIRDPVVYKKANPRAKVFGPYVEAGAMWDTVRTLRKVFPMRQRAKPLFKDRPCMNYHIGLCLAPCQKYVEAEPYDRMVRQVEMFLSGRQTEVVDEMKKEMESLSEELRFEEAAKLRDRLKSLYTVIEKQQVFFQNRRVCQDIIAQAHTEKMLAVCLMKVREGKLIASETVTLPLLDKTNWDEAYDAFIEQYYTSCEDIAIPSEVLLAHKSQDMDLLRDFLTQKAGSNVKVLVPQRGGKTDLIEMAEKNAKQTLTRVLTEEDQESAQVERILTSLKEGLGIDRLPQRIECFDISNIQGTDNVASMVVFEKARPKKSDYRMFKIKSVEGEPNDFASMKEAVGRRYSRILSEGKPFPDLIIIDGGKGQLGAAMEALTEIGLVGPKFKTEKFAICGLAKRQEEVYFPGNSIPVYLPRRSEALLLMQHVRDEAHRFALTYHRKLRAKRVVSSKLDALKGLGAKRRKILIDHFGSFDKIKKASLDDILSVSGIPEKLARTVYDFVRSDGKVAESPLDEDAEKPGAITEVLDEIAEEQDEIGEPEELSEELSEELETEEQEPEELEAKDDRQEG
jgi:excinuclease ABC subunit C